MPGIADAVPYRKAAELMDVSHEALRRWIGAGLFTPIRTGPGKTAALLIPRREIAAYCRGGIDAVRALRAPAKPKKRRA